MISIRKIDLALVYNIRNLVLRIGKPVESCFFKDDDKDSTIHFGIFLDDKLVGVASLFDLKNQFFLEQQQYQLRGMAVLEDYQKRGFGNLLIQKTEEYCKNNSKTIIWFNARLTALKFYEKLGYSSFGTPFNVEEIGLHCIMYKKITSV